MAQKTSRIKGMRDLAPDGRLEAARVASGLGQGALGALSGAPGLPVTLADGMIENVVGTFELPVGVATNFVVNGREMLVPMAVEEPSVVAAASYMARIARDHGGFIAEADAPVMRGQVQILGVADLAAGEAALRAAEAEIIAAANARDAVLVSLGGGCVGIEVHAFAETGVGPMLVLHLLVDVRDAMGANAVNTMAEAVAPLAERLTGGQARLRILSNLADRRLVRARVTLPEGALDMEGFTGARVAQGIMEACVFAEVDPYRAATHNKGIMNGIDPVVLATGNDWRAIEAGAHAFAARDGRYTALTRWRVAEGRLTGEIELPMAVGLVGGATKTHPGAQAALALMGVETVGELAEVIATVGLAQNMAALRALATEGIQRGHMALHARNLAIAAGAVGAEVDRIAASMVAAREVTAAQAQRLVAQDRKKGA
ncbi:Hydroxymethylglutaryl-CoA reductase [Candidatus Rhodobacter oscarellae]|uniref:3-hydroxy-3-methylglutaryl coenzyme A reductase n=1 Tax=Candidatus Rhodobacter oscarellae TaxID=1675527 RepID=A0A0J9GTA8_9RHOB|nr:hydroxymethylglutaryl-CoA reductase, degradative [Candidatus Rhodobacter lobularis]KMW56718.1 Hydroxymethylglutaryl-CoA reductase [Candidatus Rhodobacter lobularis]